eukprot:5236037-Pyramimonas_sp.AAC.1
MEPNSIHRRFFRPCTEICSQGSGSWCTRNPGVYMFRCFPRKTDKKYTPHHPGVVPDPQKIVGLKNSPPL